MSSQRMFWISGASTLAVLLVIGGALLARSQRAEAPTPSTLRTSAPADWNSSHKREKPREQEEEDDD